MCFKIAHFRRFRTGVLKRCLDTGLLHPAIGGCNAIAFSVLVYSRTADNRADAVTIFYGITEPF